MSIWQSIRDFFRKGPATRWDDRYKVQLAAASHAAGSRLGYMDICRYVGLRVVKGTIHRGGNRWGAVEPISKREAGGWCEKRGANSYRLWIVCDPATMMPAQDRVNHEYGHAILFSHGEKQENHEKILAAVGL